MPVLNQFFGDTRDKFWGVIELNSTLTFFPAPSTKSEGNVKTISFLPSIFLFSFQSPIGSSCERIS